MAGTRIRTNRITICCANQLHHRGDVRAPIRVRSGASTMARSFATTTTQVRILVVLPGLEPGIQRSQRWGLSISLQDQSQDTDPRKCGAEFSHSRRETTSQNNLSSQYIWQLSLSPEKGAIVTWHLCVIDFLKKVEFAVCIFSRRRQDSNPQAFYRGGFQVRCLTNQATPPNVLVPAGGVGPPFWDKNPVHSHDWIPWQYVSRTNRI